MSTVSILALGLASQHHTVRVIRSAFRSTAGSPLTAASTALTVRLQGAGMRASSITGQTLCVDGGLILR
jgi:NAD(P)-dependent dehydrogenase (short-subunit alcohol dehydrogenase family)